MNNIIFKLILIIRSYSWVKLFILFTFVSIKSLFGFGFFFGEEDDFVDEVGDPLLGEAEALGVLADSDDGLHDGGIAVVVFVEDVVDGLFRHGVEHLLHEARESELELHQVACEHHQFLCKALELKQVGLCVLNLFAAFAEAGVDFLEEVVVHAVHLFEHVLTAAALANTEFIIDCGDLEGGFEDSEVRECCEAGDAEVGCHRGLEVDADEGHEVLHAAYARFFFFLSKNFIPKTHIFV